MISVGSGTSAFLKYRRVSRCHRCEILLDIIFRMYCSTWKDKTTTYLLLMGPKSGQLVWYAKYPMNYSLVGGWTNPSEKYESNWIISINRDENKTCFKPPPSSVLQFQPFQLRTACGTVHQTHQWRIWAADIWLGSTDHQRSIPGHCFNGFLLRFHSGEKIEKSKTEEKKIAWEKKSNKYLNLFENLASLRPQASSFPWLYHCSCLDHAPLRFPKALRCEDTQIEQPPKTQEECFGFSSATETLSGRSSYTLGSHISVCFSWFLHFSARHLFPFFAQRIQGLSTENSCQLFSARSR